MIVLYGTEYKSSVMTIIQVPFYSHAKPLLRLKEVQTWFGISFMKLIFYNTQGISCSSRGFLWKPGLSGIMHLLFYGFSGRLWIGLWFDRKRQRYRLAWPQFSLTHALNMGLNFRSGVTQGAFNLGQGVSDGFEWRRWACPLIPHFL